MNSANLVGRLTATPRLRHTATGTAVADLRLAVDRRTEGTDFLTVTAWSRTAEVAAQHLTTGRRVAVSGRLEQQTWTDRDTGANREKVVVVADRIQFLDAPRRDGPHAGAGRPKGHDDQAGGGAAPADDHPGDGAERQPAA